MKTANFHGQKQPTHQPTDRPTDQPTKPRETKQKKTLRATSTLPGGPFAPNMAHTRAATNGPTQKKNLNTNTRNPDHPWRVLEQRARFLNKKHTRAHTQRTTCSKTHLRPKSRPRRPLLVVRHGRPGPEAQHRHHAGHTEEGHEVHAWSHTKSSKPPKGTFLLWWPVQTIPKKGSAPFGGPLKPPFLQGFWWFSRKIRITKKDTYAWAPKGVHSSVSFGRYGFWFQRVADQTKDSPPPKKRARTCFWLQRVTDQKKDSPSPPKKKTEEGVCGWFERVCCSTKRASPPQGIILRMHKRDLRLGWMKQDFHTGIHYLPTGAKWI